MRLIDVDALKSDYGMKDDCADCDKELRGKSKACEYDRVYTKMDFCGWLDDSPTVDAVEVVRCRDCKHYQFADNRAFGFPVKRCEWTGFEDVDDCDYCSRAERKDGDNGTD